MKQGTVSIVCGCHSPFHSLLVLISWVILYKRAPEPWQILCIFLHDIGHVGKNYLDNEKEKREHWKLGARIAGRLFGKKGFDLVAGHTHSSGFRLSQLAKPDKYSWYIAPRWWLRMGYTRWEAVDHFKNQVKESIESGKFRSTHQIYLDRCK